MLRYDSGMTNECYFFNLKALGCDPSIEITESIHIFDFPSLLVE